MACSAGAYTLTMCNTSLFYFYYFTTFETISSYQEYIVPSPDLLECMVWYGSTLMLLLVVEKMGLSPLT